MATPKKRKNGKWTMQVYVGTDPDGKRKYKRVTADTKVACQYLAAQIRQEGVPETPVPMTVRQAVEKYIDSIENVISPNTLRGYRTILRNGYPDLMAMDVSLVDNLALQEAVNKEMTRISKKTGDPVKPKTVTNGHGLITAALKKICGKEYDVTLPQRLVVIKEFPEVADIVAAVRGTSSELPCLLAAWLGLRMEEIKGLDCSSIRSGVLHIEQTRVYTDGHEVVRPYAKNDKSIRNLKIPKRIKALIFELETYRRFAETGEDGPLILTPRNRIYKRWKKIATAHGWNMTFHDLRAVNASVGLVLGVPNKYMQQRNGYKTDYTLKTVYQQLFDSARLEADKKIDEYFEDLFD